MGKRGTDHIWQLVKYGGDIAIYARCKCGFCYPCSRNKILEDGTCSLEQVPTVFYLYCPNCGARKKWRTNDIEKKKSYF